MHIHKLFVLSVYTILIILMFKVNGYDRCNYRCIDPGGTQINRVHVMCLREDMCHVVAERCANYINKSLGFTENEQHQILNLHNDLRNQVALGLKRPALPSASNMRKLMWHHELADVTQCYINSCPHKYKLNVCLDLHGVKVVTNEAHVPYSKNMENWVSSWFQEQYNFKNIYRSYYDENFAQLIWADTQYIGCGKIIYYNSPLATKMVYVACGYLPGGKINGLRVYKKGKATSNCPDDTEQDEIYTGLCSLKTFVIPDKIKCIDSFQNDSIQHIKCLRPECELDGPCKQSPTNWIGLTETEKNTLLNMHNDLRNSVALGDVTDQPSATNMHKLEWNDDIADIAQCWANACVMTHDYGCRDLYSYKVGQNMGMEVPYDEDTSIENLIHFWFNESQNYTYNEKYLSDDKSKEHYTQMLWANTKYLGCGKVVFRDDQISPVTIHLVCNYLPEGNVIGESIYKKGDPASACPYNSHKDETLTGLCALNKNAILTNQKFTRMGKTETITVLNKNEPVVKNGAMHSTARMHGYIIVVLCLLTHLII